MSFTRTQKAIFPLEKKNYFSLVTCAPKVNCTLSLESILNDIIFFNLKVIKDGVADKNSPPVPMSQETNVTWPGLMESSQ